MPDPTPERIAAALALAEAVRNWDEFTGVLSDPMNLLRGQMAKGHRLLHSFLKNCARTR